VAYGCPGVIHRSEESPEDLLEGQVAVAGDENDVVRGRPRVWFFLPSAAVIRNFQTTASCAISLGFKDLFQWMKQANALVSAAV
jgi:hypothetical protein